MPRTGVTWIGFSQLINSRIRAVADRLQMLPRTRTPLRRHGAEAATSSARPG